MQFFFQSVSYIEKNEKFEKRKFSDNLKMKRPNCHRTVFLKYPEVKRAVSMISSVDDFSKCKLLDSKIGMQSPDKKIDAKY